MTRTVRRHSDIPIAAGDLCRAGELLGRPCGCDHHDTLGEHILRATRDMTTGPAAQNLDPTRVAGTLDPELTGDHPDPGAGLHAQVLERINEAWAAALLLVDQLQALRPDRGAKLELVTTDDDWCRSCLRIGKCSPRYRGDLCRSCYDFHLITREDPPIWLVSWRHEGRRITDRTLNDAIREVKPRRRKKRRAG